MFYSTDYSKLDGSRLDPPTLAEAVRARKEMMNHIGQRHIGAPSVRQMKRYMADGSRTVWRNAIKANASPRRQLYMPGSR